MEDTEVPSPLPPDPTMADLIARLDTQIIASLDVTVAKLQSFQQDGSLEARAFKLGVQKVLNASQASLFLRMVPLLLGVHLFKESLPTEDLILKVNQTTETLKELCREQARQKLAAKATTVLEQIEAKEQLIRDQIILKQQAIAKLVREKTTRSVPPG